MKIFADGADLATIREMAPLVDGFTTNPSLMRKAGVTDYRLFAMEATAIAGDKPISFEVFADDHRSMCEQAGAISKWGKNVYVKIPVVNSAGESSAPAIRVLTAVGIKVNVTAVMTLEQVYEVGEAIQGPTIVSIFAGRIADCGVDPEDVCKEACGVLRGKAELLWASPREMFNVRQAERSGCHIITLPPDMIKRIKGLHREDLGEYSRETVETFRRDAIASGFAI